MRRPDFIGVLGCGAATPLLWSLAARAQQKAKIGYLNGTSPNQASHLTAAIRQGLSETGFVENQNLSIEYRWAEGNYDRLPALANDLVSRGVQLIVETGGAASGLAAKKITLAVPVVFTTPAPVDSGQVASLSRPGGNATGVSLMSIELATKRLDLLRKMLPRARSIAVLINPNFAGDRRTVDDLRAAMSGREDRLIVVQAANEGEFGAVFETIVQQRADALFIAPDPFFDSRSAVLAGLALRNKIPANDQFIEFVKAGGLMSYGVHLRDAYRQAGIYAGRILKGTKPSDLPVLQPTKFELAINLRTAKVLGVAVPDTLLALADEVIE